MPGSDDICILVTGATGFIGSSLLDPLANGVAVVRAGIRQAKPSHHVAANVRDYRCDLDKTDEMRDAVTGSTTVVHTAYRSIAAMPDQCHRLLAVMSAAGTSNLVFLSSIAVYGPAEGSIREDAPLRAQSGSYGFAKKQCEDLIRQWVGEQPDVRRAIILRPGIVYGAGSYLWVGKMIERIRCGAWGTFGASGEGRAALIHVDDVAAMIVQACARLAEAPRMLPGVTTVNAVGPEAPTWNAYFRALAAADGQLPLREFSMPELAFKMGAAMFAKIWRKAHLPGGRRASLAPAPGELSLFSVKAAYSTDNAAALLGFKAGIGLQEGMRRTFLAR